MWKTPEGQSALLELLNRGTLKRRRGQLQIWDALAEVPWTRLSSRRDELRIVEDRRGQIEEILDRDWPGWRELSAALAARSLPPTMDGLAALEDERRAAEISGLPERLSQRTAAAIAAPHSKAMLTDRRRSSLGGTEITRDGIVRMRPCDGISATSERGRVDLAAVASVLGEVSLPERALREGLRISGSMRAVLLIENLATFCDFPNMQGWLLAHVAGWDTSTIRLLSEQFANVPVVHFGDLDPNGVRIHQHLKADFPSLLWFVPCFWGEYVDSRGQKRQWPDNLDLENAPSLVRELAKRGLWLEQEVLAVDPRTPSALESLLDSCVFRHHLSTDSDGT